MSAKLAVWLRVTPHPTTLAESSAIYQALCKQGRVNVFTKASSSAQKRWAGLNNLCSVYYVVFPHEPPTLRTRFDVPVYHDIASASDEDPFNIRGLQDRKPMPAPNTFSCEIQRARWNDIGAQEESMLRESPSYSQFKVEKKAWLQEVLVETGTPPGVEKGIGRVVQDGTTTADDLSTEASSHSSSDRPNSINMGSIVDMGLRRDTSHKVGNIQNVAYDSRD